MSTEFVIFSIIFIVVVNVIVVTIDLRFWRNFIVNRNKRHKKVKTDR